MWWSRWTPDEAFGMSRVGDVQSSLPVLTDSCGHAVITAVQNGTVEQRYWPSLSNVAWIAAGEQSWKRSEFSTARTGSRSSQLKARAGVGRATPRTSQADSAPTVGESWRTASIKASPLDLRSRLGDPTEWPLFFECRSQFRPCAVPRSGAVSRGARRTAEKNTSLRDGAERQYHWCLWPGRRRTKFAA